MIYDEFRKSYNFKMKCAASLAFQPELNESEKAAIREELGACKFIATVLHVDTGDSEIKNDYNKRRAAILKAAEMEA